MFRCTVHEDCASFENREEAENRSAHCGSLMNGRRGSTKNAAGGPLDNYNPLNSPRIASPRRTMPQLRDNVTSACQ